jgi:hypothetical protein
MFLAAKRGRGAGNCTSKASRPVNDGGAAAWFMHVPHPLGCLLDLFAADAGTAANIAAAAINRTRAFAARGGWSIVTLPAHGGIDDDPRL